MSDHYEALYRSGRKARPKPPHIPEEIVYLWNAFTRIARARTSNGFGPNPISWGEVESYNRLTRANLAGWEVEAIMALDDAYLECVAEARTERDRDAD